jgi:hypothetical protein
MSDEDWRARAEKAERERDEALRDRDRARAALRETMEMIGRRARALLSALNAQENK